MLGILDYFLPENYPRLVKSPAGELFPSEPYELSIGLDQEVHCAGWLVCTTGRAGYS
jgi:hypothetical protein